MAFFLFIYFYFHFLVICSAQIIDNSVVSALKGTFQCRPGLQGFYLQIVELVLSSSYSTSQQTSMYEKNSGRIGLNCIRNIERKQNKKTTSKINFRCMKWKKNTLWSKWMQHWTPRDSINHFLHGIKVFFIWTIQIYNRITES